MKTRNWESLSGVSEIDRIKKIAQKMLRRMECIAEPEDESTVEFYKIEQSRLFGDKQSLLGAFIILSEFVLKLSEFGDEAGIEQSDSTPSGLSQSDVALVEAFVQKVQKRADTTL